MQERIITINIEDEFYVVQDSKTKVADQGETLPEALIGIADALELYEADEIDWGPDVGGEVLSLYDSERRAI